MSVDTTTEETTTEPVQEPAGEPTETVEAPEDTEEPTEGVEAFSRDYVEKLRKESAGYRERAKRADGLAHRLHTSLVAATGKLADPSDLPFDEAHLDSPELLAEAVQSLLTDKPHLASRRPRGDVGQGATSTGDTVDLASILRARAS